MLNKVVKSNGKTTYARERHPDTSGGQSMGRALANEIKKVLGW